MTQGSSSSKRASEPGENFERKLGGSGGGGEEGIDREERGASCSRRMCYGLLNSPDTILL